MVVDRRAVLGALAGTPLATALFRSALARAATTPAHHRTGTLADVEHVVILMQENRSFDHYFGTMNGVRGFADPRPVPLPDGQSVWSQPDGHQSAIEPFRLDVKRTSFAVMHSLPHDWQTTHQAWNHGRHDRWVETKS